MFRFWYKHYGNIKTFRDDDYGYKNYGGDLEKALRISQVRMWAMVLGDKYLPFQSRGLAEKVYNKYWDRFVGSYLMKKVKANGGVFPREKKSTALSIFLSRGFVWEDEFNWNSDKYYVKCNLAPLWYPVEFNGHGDALEMMHKIGLNGYTSCPIAGKKTAY